MSNIRILWIHLSNWYSFHITSSLIKQFSFCIGLSLFVLIQHTPITNTLPLMYSAHMLEISILYFTIPPLLLFGIPRGIFKWIRSNRFIFLLPLFSLFIFAVLLTLEHTPLGIMIFEKFGIQNSTLRWVLFLFSLSMWSPLFYSSERINYINIKLQHYITLNMILLLPACSFLVFDAIFSPINAMVSSYSLSFCLPVGRTLDEVPGVLFPQRLDQTMAAFIMIGSHKGSLWLVSRITRKYKCDKLVKD